MKFDFVIGNPPYQESRDTTKDMPVYNSFMEAAYTVSDKVELITPARFLFNAGATSKKWNEQMLQDEHFKVLSYEPDSSTVFANTDIKGGVAIHYRDLNKTFGRIEVFTAYKELNAIANKVKNNGSFASLVDMMYSPANFRFNKKFVQTEVDCVKKLSNGNEHMLATNIFETLNESIFFKNKPFDSFEYIEILGRNDNERTYRWVRKDYIDGNNLDGWKVCITKTSGIGALGEPLSPPVVLGPLFGHTQSFFSIGNFKYDNEAYNTEKYLKTKFVRALLSILKVTQDCPPSKWKYVPLQDFTENSDIDWSVPIPAIDQQLYKKYNLSQEEIDFIETNVKEMV